MGLEPGRTGLSTAIMHTGGYTHTSNGNTCMHATPTVHIMHTGACLEYLSIPPQVTEIRALQTEAVPGRRGEPESLAHWEARNSPERGGGTASFEFRKSGPTPQSDTTPQLSPSPSRVYSRASRNRRLFTGALRDLRHSMCCMRYSGRGGEGGGGRLARLRRETSGCSRFSLAPAGGGCNRCHLRISKDRAPLSSGEAPARRPQL